jgi:hypothetical protein
MHDKCAVFRIFRPVHKVGKHDYSTTALERHCNKTENEIKDYNSHD